MGSFVIWPAAVNLSHAAKRSPTWACRSLMSSEGGGDIEWLPKASAPVEFSDYWSKHIGDLAVFFPINGARLPEPTEAEQWLMKEHGRLAVREAM